MHRISFSLLDCNDLHKRHNTSHVLMRRYGFNLQSWTDGEQAQKRARRYSHAPNIDRLQLAAFTNKHEETTLCHMAAAPKDDSLHIRDVMSWAMNIHLDITSRIYRPKIKESKGHQQSKKSMCDRPILWITKRRWDKSKYGPQSLRLQSRSYSTVVHAL